jgi:Bacteriophage HK97-gp10, putative tail-component
MAANLHPNAHPDAGEFRDPIALAAALAGLGPATRARVSTITRHYAMLLRVRIQQNASGRPGPRVITGQYRASWQVRVQTGGGAVTAEVFTDAPQARRLEYGFVGVDALGRHYRQPPYPHIGPAWVRTQPAYIQALAEGALP